MALTQYLRWIGPRKGYTASPMYRPWDWVRGCMLANGLKHTTEPSSIPSGLEFGYTLLRGVSQSHCNPRCGTGRLTEYGRSSSRKIQMCMTIKVKPHPPTMRLSTHGSKWRSGLIVIQYRSSPVRRNTRSSRDELPSYRST